MTQSQTYLRQAEMHRAELDKLEAQLKQIECTIYTMTMEEDAAREKYRLHLKEERESRRNFVCESLPRLSSPNRIAFWAVWHALQNRVTSHPCYSWPKPDWTRKEWVARKLLLSLAKFNQSMLAICNFAQWNPRNTNPHLP